MHISKTIIVILQYYLIFLLHKIQQYDIMSLEYKTKNLDLKRNQKTIAATD